MWAHGPQQSHPQLLITDINDINVGSWSTTKPSTATYHRYQCGLMVHNKAIHSYLSQISMTSMWAHGPQQSHPQLLITDINDINVGSWSTTKPPTATYHRSMTSMWAHGPQQSRPQLLITDINDINVGSWSTTKPPTATYHRSMTSMWAHGPQQSHPQLLITDINDINVGSWSTTKPSTATYHRYQ